MIYVVTPKYSPNALSGTRRGWCGTLLGVMLALCGLLAPAMTCAEESTAELEAKLAKQLSGAKLVGTFTVEGKATENRDGYDIVKARKLSGRNWEITSKMKVGETVAEIPIIVQIDWVAETAVLSLTDLTIPGLGTFRTRLLFDGDRYAGTWQHGDHGGHMWGQIVPAKEAVPAKDSGAEDKSSN